MTDSWSNYTPMGKALIYLRDCMRFTGGFHPDALVNHMREMLLKGYSRWTRADLTALATGAVLLLAEKLCPGESKSKTPEINSDGPACTGTNETHSLTRMKPSSTPNE